MIDVAKQAYYSCKEALSKAECGYPIDKDYWIHLLGNVWIPRLMESSDEYAHFYARKMRRLLQDIPPK